MVCFLREYALNQLEPRAVIDFDSFSELVSFNVFGDNEFVASAAPVAIDIR